MALIKRWQDVLELMSLAAAKAGRDPGSVRLVAVSKLHPAQDILTLFEAGQRSFGENYVQEVLAKMEVLPKEIDWHFIGHLQSNKVKSVVGRIGLIHGLDSLKLAHSLHERAAAMALVQDVLVQVNLAEERQKSGILEADLPHLAEFLSGARNLRWRGLMLIPPFFDDPAKARPYFIRLRTLNEKLRKEYGLPLPSCPWA